MKDTDNNVPEGILETSKFSEWNVESKKCGSWKEGDSTSENF